ncbi:MAG: hypothetical protein KJ066_21475 [Acidobacteria bacterium]|nr:hypothetical protein [Acidobacteriota bacterium]
MSDRKYRQRGYQDDQREAPRTPGRPASPPRERAPRGRPDLRDPRAPNVPAFAESVRCTNCGAPADLPIGFDASCPRCRVDLHACSQCASFDPGSRFECMQPIAARVTPKHANNRCTLFEPRTRVERQTGSSTPAGPDDAKSAFDRLFKI